jgi:DNA polymerase-3 subunit gamma/tau
MAWKRFAFKCKEDGMDTLYAALSGRDPKVNLETFMITHEIDNTVQKTFLETNEAKLMAFLRNELENFSISLTIVEVTGEDSKKLYSGKDKFEDMVKRNPHLQTLQKRFKLDIDF